MERAKPKYLLFSLIIILTFLMVGGTGCELLPDFKTSTSPPSTQTDTPINPTWTYPGTVSPDPALPSFVAVVEKVKPSVVAIETDTGAGSGWIIDTDGIIVTNNHVVADADSIFITLDDGRTFSAESVRTDPITDIAIIQIDAQNLPAADVSDCCELKVGQPVAAIGNALGLGISLKGGWISRLDATITVQGRTLYGLIETDAAINPGNSGGPLVNMAGEVIGITSVKLVDIEVEGVGYAISIDTALPVINDLITLGYVVHPFLGIQWLHTVDQAVVSLFNLDIDRGVLFTGVVSGGPADKAGLEPEDVIVAVDDEDVTTVAELVQAIRSKEVGQEIKITYWRGSTQSDTYATLVEMPPPE